MSFWKWLNGGNNDDGYAEAVATLSRLLRQAYADIEATKKTVVESLLLSVWYEKQDGSRVYMLGLAPPLRHMKVLHSSWEEVCAEMDRIITSFGPNMDRQTAEQLSAEFGKCVDAAARKRTGLLEQEMHRARERANRLSKAMHRALCNAYNEGIEAAASIFDNGCDGACAVRDDICNYCLDCVSNAEAIRDLKRKP